MTKKLFMMLAVLMPFSDLWSECGEAKAALAQSVVIRTESGQVKGIDQEGSVAFLGIPYAKVERFMPPQPVDKWEGIRVCDHWGPQAMQSTWGRKLGEDEMSEQCCVLNVWTTSPVLRRSGVWRCEESSKLKPVMVWLHGGGFDSGTSAWNPGMQLAKKDVVVVSVNHRLNILGFLDLSACSPKYKYSGNVGMLDVVQALQWVQKNIRQFGGDPTNVTIFGESGGGGKVGTLLCMPQAKGLFHKAIIMSGTILNVNTKQMTEELGQAVLKELNIDAKHIEDINKVPYDTLYAAGQRAMAASIGTRKPGTPMMWGFGPTPDGETLLQQPFQPGFASISDEIPILMGTTFNELQRLRYDQPMTQDEARRELYRTFGFDANGYLSAFAEAYPDHSPQDLLSIDWLFRPKTIITADAVTAHRSSTPFSSTPLYMYMFTWRSPVNKGSVHGHELKFCFNTLHHAANELPEPSEADRQLAETMSSVWAQFAHDGNPNISGLPAWHPYTKENGELMVFDHQCAVRNNPDRRLEEIIDKHCFQQLDDFRAKQSSKTMKAGDVTMTIYPTQGAKIMSLKYKGQEVISQQTAPESFGSTFWTSPQKEWNWPPVPEFDKGEYQIEEHDGRLVMTSEVSPRLKYRVRKEFVADDTLPQSGELGGGFVITYSIINESDETRQVAPWEITRVENDGGVIFFDAPLDSITPAGLMDFKAGHGAVWYHPDETGENRKINADGKGWYGYCNKGLLLLKKFDDLFATPHSQGEKPQTSLLAPAPGEAEIQVYVNRGKTFIELEAQGAYTTLKPHEALSWTVRWYLLPVAGDGEPSAELMQSVRKLM
jgi:para-nitrobenzyl esterase